MEIHNISDIANKLGKEWYVLGVNMGYSKAQLENLREIYPYQPVDRNLVMLFKWSQQVETFGIDTKVLLSECLEETGFKDLAEDILQDESSNTKASAIPVDERKKLDTAIRNINFDIKEKEQSVFVGQKIKRIINCTKCKNLFRTPKNLPCGHTFCRPCIVSLLKENDKTCPTCKECIMLHTEEDVDGLTTNTLIRDLITINEKYQLWFISDTTSIPCGMCDKPESSDFCIDCLIYMCRICSTSHAQWPAHRTHKTLEVNIENEPVIELRKKIPQCSTHGKELISFCVSCCHGVCEDCKESSHKDHDTEDLHSHCQDIRKEINSIVKAFEKMIKEFSDCLDKYDKKEHELYQEKETIHGEVDSIMARLREQFEEKVTIMKSGIDEKYDKKCQQLQSEKKLLVEEKTKLSSRVDYLKFLHEYGSDAHIVTEYDKNNSYCATSDMNAHFDNLKTFVIEFRKNPSLEQMVRGLNLGTLDDYYVENEIATEEEINKDAIFESSSNEQSLYSVDPCYSESFEKSLMIDEEIPPKRPPPLRQFQQDVKDQGPDSMSFDLPPPLPSKKSRITPLYAESLKTAERIKAFSENIQTNTHSLASKSTEEGLELFDCQHKKKGPIFVSNSQKNREEIIRQNDCGLIYHYAVSEISDDYSFQSDSFSIEEEVHEGPHDERKAKDLFSNSKIEKEKLNPSPQAQQIKVWKTNEISTNVPSPSKARMLYDFKIVVSGMAVSGRMDIALISFESRCINILHYEKKTFSAVSHECRKIGAPFDGVYSEDKDHITGLFFTETDKDKRGVKILYKKNSKLKLMNFTNRIEDPRGISANDQNIFVCDRSNCRILVFKKDGELLVSVSKVYSRFDMPIYVFADGHEQLIVTDPNTNTVRVLSGIEDRCTVLDIYRSSDFMLANKIIPGKCCLDHNGAILIPDKNNFELLNCRSKKGIYLSELRCGEIPAAVSQLSSTEIVMATTFGKLVVFGTDSYK